MSEAESSIPGAGSHEVVTLIEGFFSAVRNEMIEIYNEFSLQHELGIYLREKYAEKKVQFERNVEYFGLDKSAFVKKEIDISVFSDDKTDFSCVFELKYPRNGKYPEEMYSFCEGIVFLEQMVRGGFEKAYFVAVVDDPLFYSGPKTDGIYAYFRSNQPIEGSIQKPTGSKA